MKFWSLLRNGKETGEVLLHIENREEVRQFGAFLKDFLKQNPRRGKVKEWIKEMRKNIPFE